MRQEKSIPQLLIEMDLEPEQVEFARQNFIVAGGGSNLLGMSEAVNKALNLVNNFGSKSKIVFL